MKRRALVASTQGAMGSLSIAQLVTSIAQDMPGVYASVTSGNPPCLSESLKLRVADSAFGEMENKEEVLSVLANILELRAKRNEMKEEMSAEKLGLLPEVHSRIAVLKNLDFIDEDEMVTLKGRCCCFVGKGGESDA